MQTYILNNVWKDAISGLLDPERIPHCCLSGKILYNVTQSYYSWYNRNNEGFCMKKLVPLLILLVLLPSVLFADSFFDSRIVFDVPTALEVRSEQYEQLVSRVADDAGCDAMDKSGEDAYKVVLQQKGLNAGDAKSDAQYCRITITVSTDDSSPIPNWFMRESFASLSPSEREEYETMIHRFTEMTTSVIEWYPMTTEDLGGLFAIRNHYTRKSTSGNSSPVEVYFYTIPEGVYTITIFCSYRQNQALTFAPAINEFLESLTFNFSNDDAELESSLGSQSLYTHTIPGANIAFSWPESNPSWTAVGENSSLKVKQLEYSSLSIEGYACKLGSFEYKSALSDYQMSALLASTMNETLSMMRKNMLLKNLKLLENLSDRDAARIRYSYTATIDTSPVYGFSYWVRINSRQVVFVSAEYYPDCGGSPEAVLQSVMDSVKK